MDPIQCSNMNRFHRKGPIERRFVSAKSTTSMIGFREESIGDPPSKVIEIIEEFHCFYSLVGLQKHINSRTGVEEWGGIRGWGIAYLITIQILYSPDILKVLLKLVLLEFNCSTASLLGLFFFKEFNSRKWTNNDNKICLGSLIYTRVPSVFYF